jgi:hypothetical protein
MNSGIESVIIEPGAYQTAVFGNSVVVADASRADSYGAVNQFLDKIGAALAKSAGNAQEVADVVLRVIDTLAGQRPLRYRVSAANFDVGEI